MTLAERMKKYEYVTRTKLYPKLPVIIRVDGRAFHTFTKRYCAKPFDGAFRYAMHTAAGLTASEMQGFKCAYIQSDEVTFLLSDMDSHEAQGWFDYNLSKVLSISAALMSVHFNYQFNADELAVFDSRAFNIPVHDIPNMFLWRALDWKRNSLMMYAREFFTHSEVQGKRAEELHEMLYAAGRNWATDLLSVERNGAFIFRTFDGYETRFDILATYSDIRTAFETYNIL